MTSKRHVALSVVALWLVLDIAADVAQTVACTAPTDPATLAACVSHGETGETLAEKVRRLLTLIEAPAEQPTEPPPRRPMPSHPESQIDRLRQAPSL